MPGLAERVEKLEQDVGNFDMQVKQHFDEQFTLLSEAIGKVRGQVTDLDQKVTALDRKVTALDGRVNALNGKITALDGTITAVDRRLGRFQRDVKAGFVAIDVRLDGMSTSLRELLRRTAPKRRRRAPSRKKR